MCLWNYNQLLATTHLGGSGRLAIPDHWLEGTLAQRTPRWGRQRKTNRVTCATWNLTSTETTESSEKRKDRVGGREREKERESFQDPHPRDSGPVDLG